MRIKYCTFTGVDDQTSLEELTAFSERYDFVEWGVLFSETAGGNPEKKRYASLEKIEEINQFLATMPHLNFALHLCGDSGYQVASGERDVTRYASNFKRIQFNVMAKKLDLEGLKRYMAQHAHVQFITQHNFSNQHLAQALKEVKNHHILFDTSGGRGQSPTQWPELIDYKFCGYAGGLGPHNIVEQLIEIEKKAQAQKIWIDMESSLRTPEDAFSLALCAEVASDVKHFQDPTLRPFNAHAKH